MRPSLFMSRREGIPWDKGEDRRGMGATRRLPDPAGLPENPIPTPPLPLKGRASSFMRLPFLVRQAHHERNCFTLKCRILAEEQAPDYSMRIKRKPDPGRHHLVLLLAADEITVAHWHRGWLGWRQASLEQFPVANPDFDAEEIHGLLRGWLARGRNLPAGVAVSLVLPAAIGGLSLLDGDESLSEAAIAGVLPFPVAETSHLVLPAGSLGKGGRHSLFWLHRDWVAEFQGLLGKLHLRLAEVFARAQLFSPALAGGKRPLQAEAVVEAQGGRLELHLYLPDGTPFRSAGLAASGAVPVSGQIRAELASAAARGVAVTAVRLVGDGAIALAEPLRGAGVAVEPAPSADLGGRLGQLWQSRLEGLWFPPPRRELLRDLNRWSIVAGVGGFILFSVLVWQTGALEKEIVEAEAAVRKLKPRYQKALVSEKEAVQIAETRRGLADLERQPSLLDPLARLAETLPAGVWLTRFEFRAGQVRLAGYGMAPAELREALGKQPGFTGLKDVAPPPEREGRGLPFALEGRWAPEAKPAGEKGA